MAGNILMNISQDERERAVFRSRRMYQTDLQSDLGTAEERGMRIGEERGMRIGKLAIAQNLLKMNLPAEQVAIATGLTRDEVERLK